MYSLGSRNLVFLGFLGLVLFTAHMVIWKSNGTHFLIAMVLPVVLMPLAAPPGYSIADIRNTRPEVPKEGLEFRFDFKKLAHKKVECSLDDFKFVFQGDNLSSLDFFLGEQAIVPRYSEFKAEIPVKYSELRPRSRIKIVPKRDAPIPTIYRGPSFKGGELYLDAVFLIGESAECRVLLHSSRLCTEDCVYLNDKFFEFQKLT
jgi:hypothetical protein